jgi:hypothetical protein
LREQHRYPAHAFLPFLMSEERSIKQRFDHAYHFASTSSSRVKFVVRSRTIVVPKSFRKSAFYPNDSSQEMRHERPDGRRMH